MNINFSICFSILLSCFFALSFAKSIARFDPSKLRGLQPYPALKNSIEQDAIFISHSDGSIYNVDPNSGDVRWMFSSGEPLLSSFQAFPNSSDRKTESRWNYDYIDIENGSTFVVKGPDGKVKHKLTSTADQLLNRVNSVPTNIFAQQIVMGSKKTEVYLLDANSGRVVRAASMKEERNTNHGSSVESEVMETGDKIIVVRTNYRFQSFSPLGETKWDLNYSDYAVAGHSQRLDDQNSVPWVVATTRASTTP